MSMSKALLSLPLVLLLSSCGGGSTSRIHEKQRTPSDIKISHLDLKNNTIDLRFNYRTYRERTLISLNCDIEFNQSNQIKFIKQFRIKLGAFSTEILSIDNVNMNTLEKNNQSLSYSLECVVDYDKGREFLFTDSVLHLVPSSSFQYR